MLRISIDERSASSIKKDRHTIFYRFRKITAHGIKKEEKKTLKLQTNLKIPICQEYTNDRMMEVEYGESKRMEDKERSLGISSLNLDMENDYKEELLLGKERLTD